MKKLFIIVFLFILSGYVVGQTVSRIVGSSSEYLYQDLSLRNTPLFNSDEIKSRKIKSCTIIHPWMSWYINQNVIDTLYIFDFDETGNIKREIRFRTWARGEKDTIYWPMPELQHYKRIDSTVEKQNDQNTVSKYFIWAFNPENEEVDTGYIQKYVYDNRNRLVNFKMNGTVDYHMIYFCGTGITHDKYYRYDDKDRIIFYQSYEREYATFKHQKNRCQILVFDKTLNKVSRKYFIYFKLTDESITENDRQFTIKLARLTKGSNLFSHISHKQNGDFTPSNYVFIYDHFEEPRKITEPLITKK